MCISIETPQLMSAVVLRRLRYCLKLWSCAAADPGWVCVYLMCGFIAYLSMSMYVYISCVCMCISHVCVYRGCQRGHVCVYPM